MKERQDSIFFALSIIRPLPLVPLRYESVTYLPQGQLGRARKETFITFIMYGGECGIPGPWLTQQARSPWSKEIPPLWHSISSPRHPSPPSFQDVHPHLLSSSPFSEKLSSHLFTEWGSQCYSAPFSLGITGPFSYRSNLKICPQNLKESEILAMYHKDYGR